MALKDQIAKEKETIAEGRCPECNVELEKRDPRKHSIAHYGEQLVDPVKGELAAARQRALLGRDE